MALATLNPVQDSVKTDVPNAFSLSTTEEIISNTHPFKHRAM